NDNDPHEGKGQREVAAPGLRGKHRRPRNQALNEKSAQEYRRAHAAGNAKGDGWDHGAAQGGMVRRAWGSNSLYRAFAKAIFIAGALNGMGIRHPLGYGAAHAGNDTDVGAESTAANDQSPMAEGVLDPLEDTHDFPHIRLGNARPGNRHVDDLGNREQAQRRGHQPNSVPEIEGPE